MDKIARTNVEDILPLTPMQSGMLFHYLRAPESGHYLIQLCLKASGIIDAKVFRDAWVSLADTNEALRTLFRWEKIAKPVQVVLRRHIPSICYIDLSALDAGKARRACEEFKATDRATGVDLRRAPFRVALVKLAAQENQIVITYHNIVCDGWSIGVIVDDFQNAYAALHEKRAPRFRRKASLRELTAWWRRRDMKSATAYWANYLAGVEACVPLAAQSMPHQFATGQSHRVTSAFAPELVDELQRFARIRRVTLSAVLYSAWALLVARYTDRDDVIFGTPVAARPPEITNIERTVGMLVNTPPLRVHIHADDTFAGLLARIQQTLTERQEYEWTAAADIQRACNVEPGGSLFNNIFVVENYPLPTNRTMSNGGISVESYAFVEAPHYDLSVLARAFDGLTFDYCYHHSKFDRHAVQCLDTHYKNILQACVRNPQMRLSDVEMLCDFERQQVIEAFNDTNVPFANDKTVAHEFEAAALKYQDRAAIVCAQESIRYGELKNRVDNCTRLLQSKGVRRGTVVALMMERSIAMVVAVLGILKAGGTYLPLSQSYPDSRIRTMLRGTRTDVLIMQGEVPAAYEYTKQVVDACELRSENETNDDAGAIEVMALPESPAYIIYTSGSTGTPKGVVVTHKSVMNLMTWLTRYHEFTAHDVVLQNTSLTFDVSVFELYWWMFAGASLCLLPAGQERDPAAIVKAVQESGVTIAHFVPSSLVGFLDHVQAHGCERALDSLRLVFSSGEALRGWVVERFWKVLGGNPHLRLFNKYGPTEATVWASSYECARTESGRQSVSIGRPIDNTALYVVGRWGQAQPTDVWGELYIAGAGLANGYLNQPELTAQRFCLLPTSMKQRARVYKTGDIVRWRSDGTLDYLGRRDDQVKIRGHRVELGEIEFWLKNIGGITAATVVARDDGDHGLALWAYYSAVRELTACELHESLAKQLPPFMIPAYFIQLDSLPVLPSGKINVRALKSERKIAAEPSAVAGDEVLDQLIAIWSDVLQIEKGKIGVGKSFFELGGNSISAVRVIAAIFRNLGVSLPLNELFENPTAQALAAVVRKAERTRFEDIPKTETKEYYQLSYGQQRLWVVHQLQPDSASYNMVGTLEFRHALDPAAVTAALDAVIARHDSLRTRLAVVKAVPVQVVAKSAVARLTQHDLSDLPEGERENSRRNLLLRESTTPFDLSECPLLRATLLKLNAAHYELAIALPHIIADGWSMELLRDEFECTFYRGGAQSLPALSIQYKDYVAWQHRQLTSGPDTARARAFWNAVLVPEAGVLSLPYDYPAPSCHRNRSAGYRVALSSELTARIRQWSQQRKSGIFLSQAAALNLALRHVTGGDDILIGFPAAARQHSSLKNVVGMFSNTVALRVKMDGNASLADYCRALQSQLSLVLEYQSIPLELVCEELRLPFPRFSVFLNMPSAGLHHRASLDNFSSFSIPEVQESKFPLHYYITEYSNSIEIVCHYYSNRFKPETITRITDIYIHFLDRIVTAPGRRVKASNPPKIVGHEIVPAIG